jgi:hypothetical protein
VFFAELPQLIATPADEFVAELHAVLPQRWAREAEQIWRAHVGSA